ncbi:TPA: DNA repair protein RadC [Pseudomonas aeruginosa]|nr:DNA repair protein RadC [Pseudomonas aeruginosa]HEJ1339686.1 DNA repair protein RadC [Pseudomonas aeruginosa]
MSQLTLFLDTPLMVRDGCGRYRPADADQILEAACQVIEQKMQRGASLSSPAAVKDYLRAKLAGFDHEAFAVLFLDTRHRLIDYVEMFHGTIDAAEVHPREVVKLALRLNAAAVIVSHNHPSGNPEPSVADRALTQRLRESLGLVDVRVLDHIIVAGNVTASFAESGLIWPKGLRPPFCCACWHNFGSHGPGAQAVAT